MKLNGELYDTKRERLGGWHSRWKEGNMSIYRDKNQSTDYGRGGKEATRREESTRRFVAFIYLRDNNLKL